MAVNDKKKNYTFSLPEELLAKFKEYSESNYIPSITAGVREAMEEYSTRIEKQRLKEEMQKASKDSLFMKDLKETMEAFAEADREIEEKLK